MGTGRYRLDKSPSQYCQCQSYQAVVNNEGTIALPNSSLWRRTSYVLNSWADPGTDLGFHLPAASKRAEEILERHIVGKGVVKILNWIGTHPEDVVDTVMKEVGMVFGDC